MSWLHLTYLTPCAGVAILPGSPRSWGFCRIRLDYHRGGHVIATVPQWLAGQLSMGAHPSRSAGKTYHRQWNRGLAAGWIVEHERESAAEKRARELRGAW